MTGAALGGLKLLPFLFLTSACVFIYKLQIAEEYNVVLQSVSCQRS